MKITRNCQISTPTSADLSATIFNGIYCEDDTKIRITLSGGALSARGYAQGVYEKSATVNGKLTWTHTSSDNALWFSSKGYWMIGPKIGGTEGWLYNPVSSLPYGNGNEFFYADGAKWVKPKNEIEVELECTVSPTRPGIRNHLYITFRKKKMT